MSGRGEPTDQSGEYTISGLAAASDYRIDVWAEGYTMMFYDNQTMWHEADLVDITSGATTGIDFVLSSGKSISGIITIPEGGNTNDIFVNAYSDSSGFGNGTHVNNWSGVTGTYEITGLMASDDYRVDVWSWDYQSVFYSDSDPNGISDWMQASLVDISNDDAADIDITLGTGKTISGTVTVPEGGSLNYLWVNAWSETAGSWGNAMVEPSDGTYEIKGLSSASDFRVDIWSDTYGYQIYNGKKNWEDATLVSTESGDAPGIDFSLSEGNTISGRITSGVSGTEPVADAWVNVWSESNRYGRGEPTDSDGYFTINGVDPADDYKLDIWSQDFGWVMYKDNPPSNATHDWMQAAYIDVSTSSVTGISMILSEGGSISGNVSNGSGPIANAWVNAWGYAGGGGAETDDNGDYLIKGLPASDDYKVEVWAEGYVQMFYENETDWMAATQVDITASNAENIDFVLSTGNSLSGTVTANGEPVSYIWVNAWSESIGSWGGASTDNEGNYVITGLAPADDYVVDVWSQEYAHQFYNMKTDWMDADRVDVSAGDVAGIDFALNQGNYIEGQIILPDNSTDYWTVWVNAWSDDVGAGNGSPVMHDGTFKIAGLVPGTGYKLDVWSEDYVHAFYKDGAVNNSTTDWEQADGVDITSGSQSGVSITLGTGASIAGTVTLNGEGTGEVWIDAWSDISGTWGGTETSSDGSFTINGLLSGVTYTVSTWSWEYVNSAVTDVSTGTTDVLLALSSGVSISGNLNVDGVGIEDVWIDVWSESVDAGGWAITDIDGDFTVDGLSPGTTYVVTAYTMDYGVISTDVVVDSTSVSGVTLEVSLNNYISGTVSAASDGSVISDVDVVVVAFDSSSEEFVASTIASGSDGTFELKGLEDISYKILVKADGYGDMWYDNAASIGDAAAVVPGTENVDIALQEL